MIRKGILEWFLSILLSILIVSIIVFIYDISLSFKAKTEKVELLEIASVEVDIAIIEHDTHSYLSYDPDDIAYIYTFLYTDPDTGEICTSEKIRGPRLYLEVGDRAEVGDMVDVVTYNGRPDKPEHDYTRSATEILYCFQKEDITRLLITSALIAVLVIIFRKALLGDMKRRPLFISLNALFIVSMVLIAYLIPWLRAVKYWHTPDLHCGLLLSSCFLILAGYLTSLIICIFNSIYWNLRIRDEKTGRWLMEAY